MFQVTELLRSRVRPWHCYLAKEEQPAVLKSTGWGIRTCTEVIRPILEAGVAGSRGWGQHLPSHTLEAEDAQDPGFLKSKACRALRGCRGLGSQAGHLLPAQEFQRHCARRAHQNPLLLTEGSNKSDLQLADPTSWHPPTFASDPLPQSVKANLQWRDSSGLWSSPGHVPTSPSHNTWHLSILANRASRNDTMSCDPRTTVHGHKGHWREIQITWAPRFPSRGSVTRFTNTMLSGSALINRSLLPSAQLLPPSLPGPRHGEGAWQPQAS